MGKEDWTLSSKSPVDKFLYNSLISNLSAYQVVAIHVPSQTGAGTVIGTHLQFFVVNMTKMKFVSQWSMFSFVSCCLMLVFQRTND
jgi:hypothetical protein